MNLDWLQYFFGKEYDLKKKKENLVFDPIFEKVRIICLVCLKYCSNPIIFFFSLSKDKRKSYFCNSGQMLFGGVSWLPQFRLDDALIKRPPILLDAIEQNVNVPNAVRPIHSPSSIVWTMGFRVFDAFNVIVLMPVYTVVIDIVQERPCSFSAQAHPAPHICFLQEHNNKDARTELYVLLVPLFPLSWILGFQEFTEAVS